MLFRFIKSILRRVRNLFRDLHFLSGMLPAVLQVKNIAAKYPGPGSWSVITWWHQTVELYQENTALIYGKRKYTFVQVDGISNRYARMALESGIKPGETVAVSMENSPELICWFLGLAKIGATVALLNTNVKGSGLAQCVESCGAKRLIYSKEMKRQVETLSEEYWTQESKVTLKCTNDMGGTVSSSAPIPPGLRKDVAFCDALLHIFTSGTTGLPKAAKISHLRYFGSSLIFSNLLWLKRTDVLYCPLPLCHSSAIVLGLGLTWHNGIPFVFQKKFSASKFWSICVENDVTIIQYIGELCRYLTMAPSFPGEEQNHSVRLAFGNGLHPDVWEKFQKRFGIRKIVEFYAATEAPVGLVNTAGKVGAIGILSSLLAKKHPGKLLRFDVETGQLFRDANGRCIECNPGEVGEFVAFINPRSDPSQHFDGYSDKGETDKKILTNVLKQGDKCFCSGDLMTRDEDGYVYFVDRIGDTIRWKGENVSTTEIESIIRPCVGVKECSVYGVGVKGYEGKAGMALVKVCAGPAGILPLPDIDAALSRNLPEYARPVFLRFSQGDIDMTSTFKYLKQEFVSDGFDPGHLSRDGEHIFVRIKADGSSSGVSNNNSFVELTDDIYRGILEGSIRL